MNDLSRIGIFTIDYDQLTKSAEKFLHKTLSEVIKTTRDEQKRQITYFAVSKIFDEASYSDRIPKYNLLYDDSKRKRYFKRI